MESSLKKRTRSALSWSLIQEMAQRGLQFGFGVVMARLLTPREFGLIGLLTVLVVVSQVLLESGFGSALIQKKNATASDESSVFFFNIAIGAVLAGVLFLVAPLVGRFYAQPELVPLLRVLVLILVVNGFSVVQNALMLKHLQGRRLAMISLCGTLVSGSVGVGLAWHGAGVWSLVAQQVAQSLTRTTLAWALNAWRPSLSFSWASLRDMFRFGAGMAGSTLLSTAAENLYPLVIGKLFPTALLGYYNRAQTLQVMASQTLASVANRVIFSVFSKVQDDPVRMRAGMRKAVRVLVLVQFPLVLGLVAVARPLILLAFTEKWAPSIPMLQLMCFVGLLYPVHMLNVNVLMAVGRTDLVFRLELIKRLLTVLVLALSARFGIMTIIWGQVALSLLCLVINSHYTGRLVDYGLGQQIADFGPCLLISVVMALAVLAVDAWAQAGPLASLLLEIPAGAAVYAALVWAARLPALSELRGFMAPRRLAEA